MMRKQPNSNKNAYSAFTRIMALILAVLMAGSVIVYALMYWFA